VLEIFRIMEFVANLFHFRALELVQGVLLSSIFFNYILVNKIGVQIKTKVVLSFEVKDLGEQRVG
jgi:hypothetical protein